VGEEAKARQASFYFLPGLAEMGRHHVHFDHLHECFCSPPETGLAFRGELADRLFAGRIHLGALYVGFERKALWVQGRAMIFLQFGTSLNRLYEFAARQKCHHPRFQ
jgi:hypothetical protein